MNSAIAIKKACLDAVANLFFVFMERKYFVDEETWAVQWAGEKDRDGIKWSLNNENDIFVILYI